MAALQIVFRSVVGEQADPGCLATACAYNHSTLFFWILIGSCHSLRARIEGFNSWSACREGIFRHAHASNHSSNGSIFLLIPAPTENTSARFPLFGPPSFVSEKSFPCGEKTLKTTTSHAVRQGRGDSSTQQQQWNTITATVVVGSKAGDHHGGKFCGSSSASCCQRVALGGHRHFFTHWVYLYVDSTESLLVSTLLKIYHCFVFKSAGWGSNYLTF